MAAETLHQSETEWLHVERGSAEELVANFLRDEERRRFLAVCALRDAILAAGSNKDPAIASVKLGWWQQELARLIEGQARHPITEELQSLLPEQETAVAWLEELIVCAEATARREQPESIQELRMFCFRWDGVPLSVNALLRPEQPEDALMRRRTKHIGIANALTRVIARIAAEPNHFLIPRDLEAQTDTQSTDLRTHSIIRRLAEQGLSELASAPSADQASDVATAVLGAVSGAVLRTRRRTPGRSAHPLQSLWHAWRAARRQAKTEDERQMRHT